MNRREFITTTSAAAAALVTQNMLHSAETSPQKTKTAQPRIPYWRGFNLTELSDRRPGQAFKESDFAWMAEWGFNFARLPLSYWVWADPKDWLKIDERALDPLEQAIGWGKQYGIHLNVCLHRIPGYCVNRRELEPHRLFDSTPEDMAIALDAASYHWRYFARRYQDVPTSQLSFDLLNEPPFMSEQTHYEKVIRTLVGAIREFNADRLIFADGADIGQTPIWNIVDLGLVQSTRGYLPKMVSHYTANWVPKNEFESFEKPTWPMVDSVGRRWDRARLREELIDKWQPLVRQGVPIHVGEWGCFIQTPHEVALGWMADLLALWRQANWGWSMWNLRGQFGIVDSGRADVKYEDFRGHKLDRKMLELLLAS
ncbi:MAG: cellulase family glycosylhydrolase [Nibricoccus sp.]